MAFCRRQRLVSQSAFWLPLIGAWLSRRAVQNLAREEEPEGVRALARWPASLRPVPLPARFPLPSVACTVSTLGRPFRLRLDRDTFCPALVSLLCNGPPLVSEDPAVLVLTTLARDQPDELARLPAATVACSRDRQGPRSDPGKSRCSRWKDSSARTPGKRSAPSRSDW